MQRMVRMCEGASDTELRAFMDASSVRLPSLLQVRTAYRVHRRSADSPRWWTREWNPGPSDSEAHASPDREAGDRGGKRASTRAASLQEARNEE